jgi:hypothetical protein
MLPRKERSESFPDQAFMMKEQIIERISSFDNFGASMSVRDKVREWELLKYNGPRLVVEPGEGSWIAVERSRDGLTHADPKLCEVVIPVDSVSPYAETAPGLWSTGSMKGHIFLANPVEGNPSLEPVTLESGQAVGAVVAGAGFQQFCGDCGTTSAFAVTTLPEEVPRCRKCDGPVVEVSGEDRVCTNCGSDNVVIERYQGCEECKPVKPRTSRRKAGAVSFIACTFATVCAAVASGGRPSGLNDTRFSPV